MGQESAHLDLTILSASDLKRGWLSGDQTVAVAWVDPSLKKSTEVTSGGGSNAQWHEKLTLPLSNSDVVARHGKRLTIEIRSQGALAGDNLLGTVDVPLADLAFDTQKEANSTQTYQLVLPSGKRYGSVSFLGKIVKSGSSQSLPFAPTAASLLPAYNAGFQFNTLYPPLSQCSFENHNEKPYVHSAYPPPVYGSANCTYGMASHPIELYPPVNVNAHISPLPCAPCSNVESIGPYPLSIAPYPPPTSMYQNPTPSAPYPPRFQYPPTAPYPLETQYPPPSWYPYPANSTPLYPPSYPPRHAPPDCCGPHPAF